MSGSGSREAQFYHKLSASEALAALPPFSLGMAGGIRDKKLPWSRSLWEQREWLAGGRALSLVPAGRGNAHHFGNGCQARCDLLGATEAEGFHAFLDGLEP